MVLSSEGFSYSSGLILQHSQDPHISYFAHVSDGFLSDRQYDEMSQSSLGEYRRQLVVGDLSRLTQQTLYKRDANDFLRHPEEILGGSISFQDDIRVPSGCKHRSMAYDPLEKKVTVFTRERKMIREYKL